MSNAIVLNSAQKSVLISRMAQVIFGELNPSQALVVAAALVNNTSKLNKPARFERHVGSDIMTATYTIGGSQVPMSTLAANWVEVCVSRNLLTETMEMGEQWIRLSEIAAPRYPHTVGNSFERKFPRTMEQPSKMAKDAIKILERCESTVDVQMLELAERVYTDGIECDELHIVEGCRVLVDNGNSPHYTEFKNDDRGRMNQVDCRGPNGQSSDMARSLQSLDGVATTYNAELAMVALKDEMCDMISCDFDTAMLELNSMKEIGATAWMKAQVKMAKLASSDVDSEECVQARADIIINKPWSFIKAVMLFAKLERFISGATTVKPYIGIAFGLDAKCSGPQYGALMTEDAKIAAACGFTLQELDDAYRLATVSCMDAGIVEISRGAIKKAYMGVFYGQAAAAFAVEGNFGNKKGQMKPELWNAIKQIKVSPKQVEFALEWAIEMDICPMDLARAQVFHKAIEASFGEMAVLRQRIKAAHFSYEKDANGVSSRVMHTNRATRYQMPDGFTVAMNYKVSVDINGSTVNTNKPDDVYLTMGLNVYKFKELKFRTTEDDLYAHARTGFVNMIQATDALVARTIITRLGQEHGAQHVICVHDCFRVNINDFLDGKLHGAIEDAYMDIFGSETPMSQNRYFHGHKPKGGVDQGVDILGRYFSGVRQACDMANAMVFSQFKPCPVNKGEMFRDMEINDEELADLIKALRNDLTGEGDTYYFAK